MDLIALNAGLSDAEHELKKLRRMNQRVRYLGFLDKLLLSELRPKIAAVLEPVRSDDR